MSETESRTRKRQLAGVVVSTKSAKTAIVEVERRTAHPLYGRVMTRTKRFHAHDETGQAQVGQRVRIEERRPLSRLKRWEVIEVLER